MFFAKLDTQKKILNIISGFSIKQVYSDFFIKWWYIYISISKVVKGILKNQLKTKWFKILCMNKELIHNTLKLITAKCKHFLKKKNFCWNCLQTKVLMEDRESSWPAQWKVLACSTKQYFQSSIQSNLLVKLCDPPESTI